MERADLRTALQTGSPRPEAGEEPIATTVLPGTHGDPMAESFDPAIVAPLRAGKPDLWKRLVGIFLEHTTQNLEILDRALQGNDCAAVHMTAHSLKSSSANMGATKLSDLFRRLEAAAKEAKLDTGDTLFAEIRREFEIVSSALAQDVGTEKSTP